MGSSPVAITSLLEKIKAFVSDKDLMLTFVYLTKKIHDEKGACCDLSCEISKVIVPLNICFQQNVSLNEKKIFFLDSALSMETFLSIYQKILFEFRFKEINKNGNFFYCKFA